MRISCASLFAMMLPVAALAAPGITTTDVNFRAGPGTDYESLGVLPGGTPVDIVACNAGGTWCTVAVDGQNGYVSGNYVREAASPLDEPPGTDVVEPIGDLGGADGTLLSDAELDTLVAPIALYPDNLVAQVLVAATFPLDLVKADRWIDANTGLAPDAREAAAAGEGWDESVTILAAGFPSVVKFMAADLDWTQDLGDAMLAQSEDVLDAVQRQRGRAQAVGNLASNEAQVVETVNNTIVIEPAQPDKVYVPAYDPVTTYTTRAPQQPVYVDNVDSGWDTGAVLATGAIAFGTGLAINAIFDNDYRDYWYGPPRVHWDDGYFYPRPGYRPPYRPGWDRYPGRPVRPGRDISVGGNVNIGNEIDFGNRPGRPGFDRPGGERPGAWTPDSKRRQEARRSIERRQGGNAGRADAGRPGGAAGRPASSAMEQRLKAHSGNGAKITRKPGAAGGGAAPRKTAGKPSALSKPRQPSASKAHKASSRGKTSASRRVTKAAPRQSAHKVSRPAAARAPVRRAAPGRTAMHKAPAHRVNASRSRGHHSRGGGGHRRRR